MNRQSSQLMTQILKTIFSNLCKKNNVTSSILHQQPFLYTVLWIKKENYPRLLLIQLHSSLVACLTFECFRVGGKEKNDIHSFVCCFLFLNCSCKFVLFVIWFLFRFDFLDYSIFIYPVSLMLLFCCSLYGA